MNLRKVTSISAIIAVLPCSSSDRTYEGLSGEDLRLAIAGEAIPQQLCGYGAPAGSVWEAFALTDANADGTVVNRFSPTEYEFNANPQFAASGMTTLPIVHPDWWLSAENLDESFTLDLVNLIPASADVPVTRSTYPPGIVTSPSFSNGYWSCGIGLLYGQEVNYYQPPVGYEGDFARVYFYMITLHPATRWNPICYNFIDSTSLPFFSKSGITQLLSWHYSDPPDDTELERDRIIETIQGNYNPFVRNPLLVDYLFGDMRDTPYEDPGSDPDQPRPRPLKSTYAMTETWLWLQSEYIPSDAVWTIDGEKTDSECISLQSIGTGTHRLSYSSATESGKLLIKVTP